ncbi:hypothetical protein FPQ18DRAFT_402653 [Pyronema domesticum]|nr:hypothetical protein FPQ18DRAFT_402653 [Pyronema domesticum]
MPPITRSKSKALMRRSSPYPITTTKERRLFESSLDDEDDASNAGSESSKLQRIREPHSNYDYNNDNSCVTQDEEEEEEEYKLPALLPEELREIQNSNTGVECSDSELSDLCSVFNEYNPLVDEPQPWPPGTGVAFPDSVLSDICSVLNEYNHDVDGPVRDGMTFVDGRWQREEEGEYELPPLLPEEFREIQNSNTGVECSDSELSDLCSVFNEYHPDVDGPIPDGKSISDFVDGRWT